MDNTITFAEARARTRLHQFVDTIESVSERDWDALDRQLADICDQIRRAGELSDSRARAYVQSLVETYQKAKSNDPRWLIYSPDKVAGETMPADETARLAKLLGMVLSAAMDAQKQNDSAMREVNNSSRLMCASIQEIKPRTGTSTSTEALPFGVQLGLYVGVFVASQRLLRDLRRWRHQHRD